MLTNIPAVSLAYLGGEGYDLSVLKIYFLKKYPRFMYTVKTAPKGSIMNVHFHSCNNAFHV